MATTASIPPYMLPGVTVQQPSHLEGDSNLATEILPGPPSIASVQQAAQKRDPRKPSTVFSYLPPSDPGSTYSGIMHGTLIGQEPQDGPRTKRSRVDKGTASGRAQRASARNQNGVIPAVPLESTSSADGPTFFNPGPSPMEIESVTGLPDDEPALTRSDSSHNLHDLLSQTAHARAKRKDKGKGKEVDSASVKVKEEPKSIPLSSPDPPPSNLLNNHDHCSSCRSHGDLVYCDGCPRAFHLWCVDPPIENIEEGDSRWFCPACVIRKQPPAKPPPSLLSPLIHQLNVSIPMEFQLPEDIRTYFKDVGSGPKGNYINAMEYKPPRQNRLGLLEDRDPFRLKDRNGAPVLCFQCGMSALPSGLAATAPATKRMRRSSSVKSATEDRWKSILSCDFCHLHWHLDCLDPPLPSMPPYNKKWMCPNHSEKVLPIKRRVPKSNPYPAIEINRPGQSNNGNVDIIPSETTTPIQQSNRIATDEVLINGRRYRVPERTIILDFWGKLNKGYSPQQQDVKDVASSAMSSPLTSLSSLDDFGDDPQHDSNLNRGDDELKIAQMLCSLKLREQPTSPINAMPRRRTVDRAVQTTSEMELPVRTRGRPPNAAARAKRLAKAATTNGFVRPQPSTSTDSTSTLATSASTVTATRKKRSAQSTQPETITRELRSRSRNTIGDPSLNSITAKDTTRDNGTTTALHSNDQNLQPAKKSVQVKLEEPDDSLALMNGLTDAPATTVSIKTPAKRRGRRSTTTKETEETKVAPAPQKRGRKRKERDDDAQDPTYRPNNADNPKERKVESEEKGKRMTRRYSARTPSRPWIAPSAPVTTVNTPSSAPATPSLKIRLPRLSNVGSISMVNSTGINAPSKS
ncbi:hypothetical protein AGABI2DRAFT_183411 [Agaricus bisporus var. bisporus H97]|uniref:hypothetical protein n=1 Tax=Agaricus bisporus var. bisporus (strain H97 / ATCC MYA-4626 / FGSC 10389) TaxID=936046 RepID=UPI00029F5722|nr:hypothetical protein AGABI2DRAFT_183411 [Agaricus bisporus var. bisporus H97]EKV50276.1 hypothetical protein AGABI2DRAFT_183411 [Agaricus bisporus var. bisporus H97]